VTANVGAGGDRRKQRSTIAGILEGSGRLFVVLAIVAASAACSSSGDDATGTETTASGDVATTAATDASAAAAETTAAPAPSDLPGIGDPVQDEDFVFVVTGIEEPGPIYNPTESELSIDEATGKWLVVHMSVENTGSDTGLRNDDQRVVWNGESIAAPFETWNASNMVLIKAGETIDDVIVIFDVPVDFPEGGAGAVLELHYSAFSDGVEVGL